MDKDELKKLLYNMGITRHQIFVSLSSRDKKLALPLLQKMEARKLNYWCMYHASGEDRNIIGEDFAKTITSKINSCCLFVFLFSKSSIASPEVKKELVQVADAIHRQETIKVIPISLDGTRVDDLTPDVMELGLFSNNLIYRELSGDSRDIDLVITEIRTQYYDTLFEIIGQGYKTISFVDLLRDCMHRKCQVRTVSQDIQASDECSKESLLEAHIITDEVVEYDYNPYSCMLISSNLLGNYDTAAKNFDPKNRGIKYFYYCPERYFAEIGDAFRQKMRDYIMRNKRSRGEVVQLIRSDFCERNKLLYYIESLNGLSIEQFIDYYNISGDCDINAFTQEMLKEENNTFFSYTESIEEVLSVPEEFYIWLSNDKSQLNNSDIRLEAYKFVDFLNRLHNFLTHLTVTDHLREELVVKLGKHCRYFNQLVQLERWQMQDEGYELNAVSAKKLCNHLIGFTEGTNYVSRDFPNLSNWMKFHFGNDLELVSLDESVVEQALENLVFIPIKENCPVKPCYSFVVYINTNSTHASWYSTGYEENGIGMVISYDANPEAGESQAYLDAFLGLIGCDSNIREILESKQSKILDKWQKG